MKILVHEEFWVLTSRIGSSIQESRMTFVSRASEPILRGLVTPRRCSAFNHCSFTSFTVEAFWVHLTWRKLLMEILKPVEKMQCETRHCICIKPNSKSRTSRKNKASLCSKHEWHSIYPVCVFSSASFVALTMMCCFFLMFSHQLHKGPLGADDLETEILSIGFKAIFSWVLVVSVESLV